MAAVSASDVTHAAKMLVTTALHLRETDCFVVIADETSVDLGKAIAAAGEKLGAAVTLARLDEMRSVSTNHTGDRPHKVLPDGVRRAMLAAQASVYIASAPQKELTMRDQLVHIVGACRVRHAHMAGIAAHAFAAGLKVDYARLESDGRAMERRLELARAIAVESPAGTDLRLSFDAKNHWTPHLGIIVPGACCSLPAGALYAPPSSVDGVFVANASLGEFFGARQGLLTHTPVKLTIEGGRVAKVEAPSLPDVAREMTDMLRFAPNSDRVSLAAIGVNVGIESATGTATVDQNLPGLHLVIGDPAGRIGNPLFAARTSFLACGAGARVTIDGKLAVADDKLA
jgi:leucyl aminopeptidase (aminopeptidase T)